MANKYDNPDDDFMRDLDGIFDRRDAASRPASGSAQHAPGNDDGINWDDYNFNFDDEYGQEPQPPSGGWQAEQPAYGDDTEQFSIDYLRRLHQSAGQQTPGYAPSYRPPAPQPRQSVRQAPASAYPPSYEAEYEPEYDYGEPEPASSRRRRDTYNPRPKKKHRFLKFLLRLLIILLVLVLLFGVFMLVFGKAPASDAPIGTRKEGCATVLLAGTDAEGTRTDTLMLLYIDRPNKSIRLLSIPRDTMVNRDNPVPKINGAYGANGSGEAGMDVLMGYVADLIGYRPDGYMLINLDCFVDLVDLMGGVTYDVPMDMEYDDPTQDLHIDLKAGKQRLNGEQAMGLVRFRSGYAMADLERVNVQRDFLKAAMSQWTKVWKLYKAPLALGLVMKNTTTDLSARNLCWIMTSVGLCGTGGMENDTLPGNPQTVNGGAYYVEDVWAAAELINAKYNPYESEISAYDLHPYGS